MLVQGYSQLEDIFIPRDILKAYENGTRCYTGKPGPEYFQNQTDYQITAEFDPETRILKGFEEITYHNNSEDILKYIVIRNYHDVYKKGTIRGRKIHPDDVGLGTDIQYLSVNGNEIDLNDPNQVLYRSENVFVVECITFPGRKSGIEVRWETTIPDKTHERFGRVGESSFFIAYWYPQISVYDDINGWDIYDWNNLAEMYNSYGNFEVSINVPENFIVWATGVLQNPEKVLNEDFSVRYQLSQTSDEPVTIITRKDLRKKSYTKKGRNTWKFEANQVNDFAFAVSSEHLWEASAFNGMVHIHSPYMSSSRNFREVNNMTRWLLKQYADSIPGIAFPYPSITVFNGADGMEYPMIVNDKEQKTREGTWYLTAHEVTHTYFPFMVGVNQKRHGWIDEGLVTMLGVELHNQKIEEFNFREIYLDYYPQIAGTQQDVPSMVNSFYLPEFLFQQHEYMRSSLAFWILKDILGKELFYECLRAFITRWEGKHPTPYDLFFTFNDISGENWNFFYEPWFIDFSYPDIGISNVEIDESKISIILKNFGGMPYPCNLKIIYSDQESETIPIDTRTWRTQTSYNIHLDANKIPVSIVLEADMYPDSNLENNTYFFNF